MGDENSEMLEKTGVHLQKEHSLKIHSFTIVDHISAKKKQNPQKR
jgi:predicted small metal-binding protein